MADILQGVLPEVFRKSPPVSITLDFFDIASGRGYKRFYPVVLNNDTSYTLTTNTFYGDTGILNSASTLDTDFDVEFSSPITIEGESVVNLPVLYTSSSSGTKTATITVNLYKVSNAVETLIVASPSVAHAWTTGSGNTYTKFIFGFYFDIPKTTIGIGDTLRFNIVASGGSGNFNYTIFLNPNNSVFAGNIDYSATPYFMIAGASVMQLPILIDK
jgi:hypothetical protein